MGQLVLLVVAAAWAAVLVPPLLRSRIENRPNSSVSDFRNQLSSLQRTVPARGVARSMSRPLAPSPLSRPAAAGRPVSGRTAHAAPRHSSSPAADRRRRPEPVRYVEGNPRLRSHADPAARRRDPGRDVIKRRRANVLFVLALTVASAAFLAATTRTQAMVWVAVVAFAVLLGYVCLLGQIRQREAYAPPAPVARQAPRRAAPEQRRHLSSAPSGRQPATRRSPERWSHAV